MSASKVAGVLAAAVRGEVKEKLMEKIWKKHWLAFKVAAFLLPIAVVIWAVKIEHVPVAVLGCVCLIIALMTLKLQEKQSDETI